MNDWQLPKAGSRIFFVGIGGISMSGLAELAQADGFVIAGSDRHLTQRTAHLAAKGIQLYEGHSANWIDRFQPDLLVHTAAVHADNPEWQRALEQGIPVIDRASFLGLINRTYPRVINISGTHGKTTTTALCALMLIEADLDPAVHLGAELRQFHGTVRTSQKREIMVSEACEYMNSFLRFHSTTAAVLNIDYDHVDCFADLDDVVRSFTAFTDRLPDEGLLIMPDFDRQVMRMLEALSLKRQEQKRSLPRLVFFGIEDTAAEQALVDLPLAIDISATYNGRDLHYQQGMPCFTLCYQGEPVCQIQMRVPGRHNVANALAAAACAHQNGADFTSIGRVLNSFQGAEGRFTDVGQYQGARVIADYAHHPAAARVTFAAANLLPHRHLWVVFQPLTFSRTKVLFDDYVAALKDSEAIIFSEIYSDRESQPMQVSARKLADRINELGGHAWFAEKPDQIRQWLNERAGPEDVILVMGPENIRDFADQLTGRTSHLQ